MTALNRDTVTDRRKAGLAVDGDEQLVAALKFSDGLVSAEFRF